MRKNPNNKRRSSVDGFVPRRLGDQPDSGGRRRRTLNDFKRSKSSQGIEFHESWSSENENVLTIDPSQQASEDLITEEGSKKQKKPRKPFILFRRRKNKPPLTRKQKVKRVLLLIGALLVLLGGFLAWKFLLNAGRVFDGNILGFFDSTKLRGEDEGRVNILLAGTSEGDPGHEAADLTDSIMVASIDVRNNTAFTVSIPRDLWVDYGRACASGYSGKINVVYQCGKQTNFKETGYAEGGMGMLQKEVSQALGIPIHYYGKINYKAFKQAVDAVDGIEITVDSDDPRGVYDPNIMPVDGGPLKLSNGLQKLDGAKALALARSRNSAGGYGMARGDFDRTNYQRAMLLALKDKALSAGTITNPAKIGSLLDAAGSNVKTDFKTNELRRLYDLSKLINNQNVKSIDLASEETNLLTTGSYSGQSIVQPTAGLSDFSQIHSYFKKLTSHNPVVREGAKVVVLNGSGVVGLAQKRADELTKKELNVVAVANGTSRANTVVIDKTKGKMTSTKKLLEDHFGVIASSDAGSVADAANYDADFVVIIGSKSAKPASAN